MTARAWARLATERLTAAGNDDAAFDARCLLEGFGGLARGHLPGDEPLTEQQTVALDAALAERLAGRPLQYILGEWDFLSLTLSVGEGVLIPRPDTETLCEAAASRLSGIASPSVLDLCAGSGCVGLGLASLCPGARVTAVEKSPAALRFLRENTARYPQYAVEVRQADVLTDDAAFPGEYDAIVANPPYIPTGTLDGLQREVRFEPRMALDGDADGLLFYRAIAARWVAHLRIGGFCAVEVGYDQAKAVQGIFDDAGLTDIETVRDTAKIERVIIGRKKN